VRHTLARGRLRLLPLLAPALAAAQIRIAPCLVERDSLVVRHPGLELCVQYETLHGLAPWCPAFNRMMAERAVQRSVAAAGKVAMDEPPRGAPEDQVLELRTVSVAWATSELVSVREEVYAFAGGAHGATETHFRLLAWREGELRPSSLKDYLAWTPELEAELQRQLTGQLRLQGASEVSGGAWSGLEAARLADAAPTTLGLLFVVNEYEAGAYCEGAFDVLVPWRVLAPWLPAGGTLERMIRE